MNNEKFSFLVHILNRIGLILVSITLIHNIQNDRLKEREKFISDKTSIKVNFNLFSTDKLR